LLEKGRNQKRCQKLARRFLRDVASLRCCGLAPLVQLGPALARKWGQAGKSD
jgi:hypothetical protein